MIGLGFCIGVKAQKPTAAFSRRRRFSTRQVEPADNPRFLLTLRKIKKGYASVAGGNGLVPIGPTPHIMPLWTLGGLSQERISDYTSTVSWVPHIDWYILACFMFGLPTWFGVCCLSISLLFLLQSPQWWTIIVICTWFQLNFSVFNERENSQGPTSCE